MRLTGIHIKSFRAIRDVTIDSVENALILVGQNNTGKSTIIDALRVALGDIAITKKIFKRNYHRLYQSLKLTVNQ